MTKFPCSSCEDPFFCIKCFETIIPFSKLSNKEFIISVINVVNNYNKDKTNFDFLPPSEVNSIIELNNFLNQKFSLLSDDKDNDSPTCLTDKNYQLITDPY